MKLLRILPLLIILNTSCASSLTQLPTLENRTLRIDEESGHLYYQYEKCAKKWILGRRKCSLEREYYDLSVKEIRLKLKYMGFKLKVHKPKI